MLRPVNYKILSLSLLFLSENHVCVQIFENTIWPQSAYVDKWKLFLKMSTHPEL